MFVIVSVQEYQPIYLDIGMKKKGGELQKWEET